MGTWHLFIFLGEWQSCSCSTLKSVGSIWMTNWWDARHTCDDSIFMVDCETYYQQYINIASVTCPLMTCGRNSLNPLLFSLQRKEAVALHVKLLDLNNEFLVGSHMPNRIARSALPEHLHLHFANEGSFIQVGGFHADSPDDLVLIVFGAHHCNTSPFAQQMAPLPHN